MTHHLFIQRIRELRRLILLPFRRPVHSGKVFCIGYLKTGSTSVGSALRELGYRHSSYDSYVWRNYQNKRLDRVLWYARRFDAFDDLPWFRQDLVPVLEKTFPDSKFIDLVREEESWKHSMETWSKKMFGHQFDTERELGLFRKHKAFVKEHFASYPESSFITLDVTDPEGYEKLATFLGKEAPEPQFPHRNKT